MDQKNFRTTNPALNAEAFQTEPVQTPGDVMTVGGTVDKTAMLVVLALASAYVVWHRFMTTQTWQSIGVWMTTGLIGGFVLALITHFNKKAAPVTAPLYAIAEGLALGGISALYTAPH
jgi:uncharacterized YccA/Bax inhibitor family protein